MATEEEKRKREKENRRRQQDKALEFLDSAHLGPFTNTTMKDRLEREKALNIARQKIIAEAIRRGDQDWGGRYKY